MCFLGHYIRGPLRFQGGEVEKGRREPSSEKTVFRSRHTFSLWGAFERFLYLRHFSRQAVGGFGHATQNRSGDVVFTEAKSHLVNCVCLELQSESESESSQKKVVQVCERPPLAPRKDWGAAHK